MASFFEAVVLHNAVHHSQLPFPDWALPPLLPLASLALRFTFLSTDRWFDTPLRFRRGTVADPVLLFIWGRRLCAVYVLHIVAYESFMQITPYKAMEGENSGRKDHCSIDRGGRSRRAQLKEDLTAGEFIWVKVCGNSWWPGQVVNEDTVSKSSKPRKKSGGLVLVRLYGSYDYLYVDPVKCHSEFIMVLQDNNGSHKEVFNESLKKACCSAQSNALGSKLAESKRANPSKDKNRVNRNQEKKNAAGRKNNLESSSQCNIVKGKVLVPDVSERKSKTKNCYQSPDEDCIAKRKPSRQSSLQNKVKDIGKPSENVSKLKIISSLIDKSQRRGAHSYGTPKSLKRNNSSSSGIQDGSQKKLKEDNQVKENQSKQKLECSIPNAASPGRSSELSARRIRVMQSLGLVAPTFSPFRNHLKLPLIRNLE